MKEQSKEARHGRTVELAGCVTLLSPGLPGIVSREHHIESWGRITGLSASLEGSPVRRPGREQQRCDDSERFGKRPGRSPFVRARDTVPAINAENPRIRAELQYALAAGMKAPRATEAKEQHHVVGAVCGR